jgi:hypothetical protein
MRRFRQVIGQREALTPAQTAVLRNPGAPERARNAYRPVMRSVPVLHLFIQSF